MSGLSRRDLWGMAVRTSLLQATFNYERQQGIGWAWALKPALDRYYPDAALRRQRLAEHTAYFNTQPTLASLALGAVARLEERRAGGEDERGRNRTRDPEPPGPARARRRAVRARGGQVQVRDLREPRRQGSQRQEHPRRHRPRRRVGQHDPRARGRARRAGGG